MFFIGSKIALRLIVHSFTHVHYIHISAIVVKRSWDWSIVAVGYVLFGSFVFNILLIAWTTSAVEERERICVKSMEILYEIFDLIARFASIALFLVALKDDFQQVSLDWMYTTATDRQHR